MTFTTLERLRLPPDPHMKAYAEMAAASAASASSDFPSDITSPEGLIAFFGEKLRETNGDLANLIRGQQARGTLIKNIALMNTILAKYEGDKPPLAPGSDDWNEFQRLAAQVMPALGMGNDAAGVGRLLSNATKPGHVEDTFAIGNEGGMEAFLKLHPAATRELYFAGIEPRVRMRAEDGPPAGLDSSACKELMGKLKSLSENFQSDNQVDSIRVQELVSRIGQITSLASNIVHKLEEARMACINNIR